MKNRKTLVFELVVMAFAQSTTIQAGVGVPSAADVIRTNPSINNIEGVDRVKPTQDLDVIQLPQGDEKDAGGLRGIKATLRGFEFKGNTVFSNDMLLSLMHEDLDKELSYHDMVNITKKIRHLYLQKGYFLAHVYLPKQDVTSGILKVNILEGKIGNTPNVSVDPLARINLEKTQAIIYAHIKQGDLINDKKIERPLLLLRDMAGLDARSVINPGSAIGDADMSILVKSLTARMVDGMVNVDNYGNRFAGEYRAGATLNINSPLKLGDKLTLRGQLSFNEADTNLIGFNYLLPFGDYGLRMGISYSRVHYALNKGSAFRALDLNGEADIVQAGIRHPIIRTRGTNLFVSGNYFHKETRDFSTTNDVDIENKRKINSGNIQLTGDIQDRFKGLTFGEMTFTQGNLQLEKSDKTIDSVSGFNTQGQFTKIYWSIARLQQLPQDFFIFFSALGQDANKNLAVLEKIQLGGPFGVRAYPPGDAQGDNGQIYTVELRKRIPQIKILNSDLTVSAFYDYGVVTQFDEKPVSVVGPNKLYRRGYGLGANVVTSGCQMTMTIAWPESGNPATNQIDTADRDPRFYFNFSKMF